LAGTPVFSACSVWNNSSTNHIITGRLIIDHSTTSFDLISYNNRTLHPTFTGGSATGFWGYPTATSFTWKPFQSSTITCWFNASTKWNLRRCWSTITWTCSSFPATQDASTVYNGSQR
jgi:hypothetical protein